MFNKNMKGVTGLSYVPARLSPVHAIAPDHLARPIGSKGKPWALPEFFQSAQPRMKIEVLYKAT
jgi:hypothetical protein